MFYAIASIGVIYLRLFPFAEEKGSQLFVGVSHSLEPEDDIMLPSLSIHII